jgi:hypothetical protein
MLITQSAGIPSASDNNTTLGISFMVVELYKSELRLQLYIL